MTGGIGHGNVPRLFNATKAYLDQNNFSYTILGAPHDSDIGDSFLIKFMRPGMENKISDKKEKQWFSEDRAQYLKYKTGKLSRRVRLRRGILGLDD